MKSKKGLSIEQHIEKIVIGVSVLIGLWLLWVFVLSNPYGVEIRRGAGKVPPGRVDSQIEPLAKELQEKLNSPPQPVVVSIVPVETYLNTFRDPLESIPFFWIPQPGSKFAITEDRRVYRLPEIPAVAGVTADSIRTVVYRPIEEVDRDLSYSQAQTELADMDLVTVQGTVDIPRLIQSFRACFAYPRLRADWIDEKLASPVFAAVGLERRQRNEDGSWSEWARVGPTKINPYKKLMQIPETISELDLSLSVKMDMLRPSDIQKALLQPPPYDIASPKERWLAPSYHVEYRKLRTREEEQVEREERERKQEALQQQREQQKTLRGPTETTRTTPQRQPTRQTRDERQMTNLGRRTGPGRLGPDQDYMMGGDPSRIAPGPRLKPERTSEDVARDFEKKKLGDRIDWSRQAEPTIFWAHDDSLPGPGIYQYRIRIGVFNPIAGKNWTGEDQQDLKDQVILWSPYSEATSLIRIEPMYYFFPQKYLAEQDKLEVKVAKYHLGQWRSELFQVSRGEMIGSEVENKSLFLDTLDPGLRNMGRDPMAYGRGGIGRNMGMDDPLMSLPRTINFTTGAIMVDIAPATQWGGSMLVRQDYQEMLYSYNGDQLHRLALGEGFWPQEFRDKYNLIKKVEKDAPLQFLTRGQVSSSPLRTPPPTMERMVGPGGPGMERDASTIRRVQ